MKRWIWALVCAWAGHGWAAPPAALEKMLALPGLACRFAQTVEAADGSRVRSEGRLWLRRPGMFRWEYEKPYAELFVSDGRTVWHYEPDLMQAERIRTLDPASTAALRILAGRMQPGDVAVLAEKRRHGKVELTLRIRGDARVYRLVLKKDGVPVEVAHRGAMGERNTVRLWCVKRVPGEARFAFTPPEGVEVIDRE